MNKHEYHDRAVELLEAAEIQPVMTRNRSDLLQRAQIYAMLAMSGESEKPTVKNQMSVTYAPDEPTLVLF